MLGVCIIAFSSFLIVVNYLLVPGGRFDLLSRPAQENLSQAQKHHTCWET
jgi:hypothetical protein